MLSDRLRGVGVHLRRTLLASIVVFHVLQPDHGVSYGFCFSRPTWPLPRRRWEPGVTSILFFITLKKIQSHPKGGPMMSRTRDNYENSLLAANSRNGSTARRTFSQTEWRSSVPSRKTSKVLSQAAQSAQAELPGDDPGKAVQNADRRKNGGFSCFTGVLSRSCRFILCSDDHLCSALDRCAYLPVFGNAGKSGQQRGVRPVHRKGSAGDRRAQRMSPV